jgi:hypothetical protein
MGWRWTAVDQLSLTGGVARVRSLRRNANGLWLCRGQDAVLNLDNLFHKYWDNDQQPLRLALSSDDNCYDGGGEDVLLLHSTKVWKVKAALALVSCWVAMSLNMYKEGGI